VGLAVLLFHGVCATRVDQSIQAVLVLVWPFLRDRTERRVAWRGWARGWRAGLLAMIAVLTLATAYRLIALPSHHPLPETSGRMDALRLFLPQFWFLAIGEPGWMSLSAVLLAMVGAVAMAV